MFRLKRKTKRRPAAAVDGSDRTEDSTQTEIEEHDHLSCESSRTSSWTSSRTSSFSSRYQQQPTQEPRQCKFIDEALHIPIVTSQWTRPRTLSHDLGSLYYTDEEIAQFRLESKNEGSAALAAIDLEDEANHDEGCAVDTSTSQVDTSSQSEKKSTLYSQEDSSSEDLEDLEEQEALDLLFDDFDDASDDDIETHFPGLPESMGRLDETNSLRKSALHHF